MTCTSSVATIGMEMLMTVLYFWIFLLSSYTISWQSKKGSCSALSTCEAEYVALGQYEETCSLRSFGLCSTCPIPLYSDSQSTNHLSKIPLSHERSKHVALKYHLVLYFVEAKFVSPYYVFRPTKWRMPFQDPRKFKNCVEWHCLWAGGHQATPHSAASPQDPNNTSVMKTRILSANWLLFVVRCALWLVAFKTQTMHEQLSEHRTKRCKLSLRFMQCEVIHVLSESKQMRK